MDKKSKLLVAFFIIAVLISVFLTYKRSFVEKDFLIVPEETPGEEALEE